MSAHSPDEAIRGLLLHHVLTLAEGASAPAVGPSALLSALQHTNPELTEHTFGLHVKYLQHRGLVDASWTAGDMPWLVSLTPEGREEAAAFARDRDNPVLRVKQLQDDYLNWLYIQIEHEDRSPIPDDFLATNPAFLGNPFTAKELEKAGARLLDAAYIEGQTAWQYSAPLRPRLTAKGRYTIESGRSVHDAPPAGRPVQNFTTNVSGNANVAMGDYANQNLTVNNGWTEDITRFLDALSQASPTMPAEVQQALAPEMESARQGVQEQDASRVRRAFGAIAGFLGDLTSGTLANLLATQVPPLLALLP